MNDDDKAAKRRSEVIFYRPAYVGCDGWIPAQKALQVAAKVLRSEQRAEKVLLSAILDGSLHASTRGVMEDHDICPVPKKMPAKKGNLIETIWYSHEGRFFKLDAFGSLSGRSYAAVEMDFAHSQLVALRHSDGIAIIDFENGEVMTRPRGRRVHFNVEVNEASLAALLAPYRKNRSSGDGAQNADPDSDDYRVKLTETEWRNILLPLVELAQAGRLEDEFGILGRGDKQKIKDRILRLLEERGKAASISTLGRKCNALIEMNEQARSAPPKSTPDGST